MSDPQRIREAIAIVEEEEAICYVGLQKVMEMEGGEELVEAMRTDGDIRTFLKVYAIAIEESGER